jgi:hypothetical protein
MVHSISSQLTSVATQINSSNLLRLREHRISKGVELDSSGKTFAGRYIVKGGSHCLTVPPPLREKMGFLHGDYVVYVLIGDVLRLRRVTPGMVLKGEFWEGDKPKETVTKT